MLLHTCVIFRTYFMSLEIETGWSLPGSDSADFPSKVSAEFLLQETKNSFDQILEIVFADFTEVLINEKFHEKTANIKALIFSLLEQNPKHFAALLNNDHDSSTILHSVSVMVLSTYLYLHIRENVPTYLHLGSVEDFVLAVLLHDMGKIYMLEIVRKAGKLNAEEYIKMRKHPEDGIAVIERLGLHLSPIGLNIVKYHHRHANNTGYPELADGEIVHEATFLTGILDTIESITSRRRRHNLLPTPNFTVAVAIVGKNVEKENEFPTDLFDLVKEALLGS